MRLSRAGVERREAPGPTLLGQRARKRQPLVTGDLPWRAAGPIARLRRTPHQRPRRFPVLHSPFGETEKGTTARAAPQTIRAAERWLSVLAAPIRPQRISLKRLARKSPEKIDDARHQMDS